MGMRMGSFCWVNVPLPNPNLPHLILHIGKGLCLLEVSNWHLSALPVLLSFRVLHSFFISLSLSFSFLNFLLLFLAR